MAIFLITSRPKGIAAHQLVKDLKVTHRTSWYMLHQIRKCFKFKIILRGRIVEADEVFIGSTNHNRHKNKRVKGTQGRSTKYKTPVLHLFGVIAKFNHNHTKNIQKYSYSLFMFLFSSNRLAVYGLLR